MLYCERFPKPDEFLDKVEANMNKKLAELEFRYHQEAEPFLAVLIEVAARRHYTYILKEEPPI